MPRDPRPMSPRLQARVLDQGGVFSRRDAVELGHHDLDLRNWLRSKQIVQATRGGYYISPEGSRGWSHMRLPEQNAEHERLRILAVLHVLPACFVASHRSALLLHRLPRLTFPSRMADVHAMAMTATTTMPRRPGVKVRQARPGTRVSTIRAVAVEDAIAQAGCGDGEVGALVPADAAHAGGRLDLQELKAACERLAGLRGATGLVAVLPRIDGRSESPGETWTRSTCADAGIRVTPQVWISDQGGRFARVDLLVNGTRVIIEFDGLGKYDDPDAARNEKKREQRLHRAGYLVVRVTWEDFANIPALVARIRAAIARSAALGW